MFRFLNKSGYIFTNKKNPKRGIMSTVLGIISGKHFIAVCMCFFNTLNRAVFPKFVTISKLKVSKTSLVVIFQGSKVEVFIF